MRPNTRSRLDRLLVLIAVVAVVALIRELSIRRHESDLEDWPRLG